MHNRLGATLNRDLQRCFDLSLADFEVLLNLAGAAAGRMRGFELAATMHWEKSRLSHQLTRMERRGLVARRECSADGRGAFVTLTDAGRVAIESAAPRHVAQLHRYVFDALSPEQLDALGQIATAVLARLDEDEA